MIFSFFYNFSSRKYREKDINCLHNIKSARSSHPEPFSCTPASKEFLHTLFPQIALYKTDETLTIFKIHK